MDTPNTTRGAGELSGEPVVRQQGSCTLMAWSDDVHTYWFDPERAELHAQPVVDGGRGSAWYIDIKGCPGVLRHYRRGGLIARLSRDLYWWSGASDARSLREFGVLARLAGCGLRVPLPVAAMACRVNPFVYRAALITERIEQARPFWTVDDENVWSRAGRTIASMHKMGVWHADLNVNNILVGADGAVWLIDFDRAVENVTSRERLYGNLQRLERSVRKVCPQSLESRWPLLLAGYAAGAE